jgi:hypothetical protein
VSYRQSTICKLNMLPGNAAELLTFHFFSKTAYQSPYAPLQWLYDLDLIPECSKAMMPGRERQRRRIYFLR